MKSSAASRNSLVHRFHTLARERAGVLDGLLADAAKTRVHRGIVAVARLALQHAARAELGAELGILRVVGILRLLLGVEVVEVAEEFVEPVDRRQELVAVAEMVLAELAGRVALRLEQLGERRILLGKSFLGARQADLEKTGAEAGLAGDERGAPGGAGLLRVMVGEDRAFLRDAVDIRRAVAHHAAVVGADIPQPDVITEDDEDVGLPAAGAAGAGCWACAVWIGAAEPIADAAARVVPASRMLRRLSRKSFASPSDFVCGALLPISLSVFIASFSLG